MKPRHIAVIGSGISGLSAAWLLSQKHRVTLIEADNRPGGHSNTVDCDIDGRDVAVDTGFIVYNPPAYPNLTALFDHLGVPTAPSNMSFAVSMGNGAYEYAGSSLLQLVGQAQNLLNPGHWSLMRDIPRFFKTTLAKLPGLSEDVTIAEFLRAEGYSDYFLNRHLLPMAGAIWSAAPGDMRDYPAKAFLNFFDNHGLLKLTQPAAVAHSQRGLARVCLPHHARGPVRNAVEDSDQEHPPHRCRRAPAVGRRRGAGL